MPTPDSPYDRDYHKKIELEETPQAERLSEWIKLRFSSISEDLIRVTDFGCSTGIYVRALRQRDFLAIGIENSAAAVQNRVTPHVQEGNITGHCDGSWFCEIGMCIEVAEHIEGARSDDLIRCLIRHSRKFIIFSAATPGQGGVGHVNCQQKPYWIEKFERRGWVVDYVETRLLIEHMARGYHMIWLLNNAMVMRPIQRT